jgi:hypothetical protein
VKGTVSGYPDRKVRGVVLDVINDDPMLVLVDSGHHYQLICAEPELLTQADTIEELGLFNSVRQDLGLPELDW